MCFTEVIYYKILKRSDKNFKVCEVKKNNLDTENEQKNVLDDHLSVDWKGII